jgi:hypothetical protein
MRCPSCHRAYAATERVCPKDGATLLEPLDVGLRRGPWALSQTVKVLDRLLAELEPLHATGRCHGRLQPAAVLVHQLGGAVTVQLVPASAIDPPAAEYQPPELSGGQAAHDKSDLYAVGLLAHHLLAGRPPFRHAQPAEVLAQQRSAPPPSLLGLALQDVPHELDDLIRRLLAKDPAERPRGPGEVRDLLANLELDSTVMGERLKALTGEVGLGAVVPEVQEELGEAATLPPSGPTSRPSATASPTSIPSRTLGCGGSGEMPLDTEPDTVAPTGRSPGPLVGRVPAPGPSLDADTTIDPVDPATARGTFQTLPEPGTTGPKWWWIVAASALLGVSAVGAYWFFQ